MERIYVALDVETTGLEAGVDEIIEVAAVKFRGQEVLETFAHLVKPRQALPLKITQLTGITAHDLADAPSFNRIAPDFVRFVKNYPLVGHSINFDINMLRAQGMHFAQSIYDTFDLATILMPQAPVYKLSALAEALQIPHPADHRALNDADVCRQVFLHLMERITALELSELGAVNRLMHKTNWAVRELFAEVERTRTRTVSSGSGGVVTADTPPPTNGAVPPAGGNPNRADIGTHPPIPPALKPTGNTTPLNIEQITAFFDPHGPLGQRFAGYEQRPQQIQMAQTIALAFNQGDSVLVEAGTGTGKSMAYLVPAVLFAVQRGERVVVSTNTINLQDQLFCKDIPDLQRMLQSDGTDDSPPFIAALLKGRGNYLCLRRYKRLRSDENLAIDEARALVKVQLWLPTTTSGDRAELFLLEHENTAWSRINVTPDTCTGPRCADYHDCFFFKARRRAEAAHIVVVNHALLLADLSAQSNVLPPYDHLIIDEAHNLEDVATDQLSFRVDQAALLQFLDTLYQTGGAMTVSGLCADLPMYLRDSAATQSEMETIQVIADAMRPTIDRTRYLVTEFFNVLRAFVTLEGESNIYDSRLRLTPGVRQKPAWASVEQAWDNLNLTLTEIGEGLGKIEIALLKLEQAEIANYDELMLRVQFLKRYATDVRVQTGHIIFGNEERICWLTHDHTHNMLLLNAAPLHVAEILQAHLFAQKQTSILTSATISVDHSFAFIKERLGLPEPTELQLDSPFDYEQQALVYIPNDIPEPNQRGYQQMIEDALITLCTATEGRTLALFTSNAALKQTYGGIQDALEQHEIAVLGQGIDGSRRSLLERFKATPRTVLLGTSSFWEGVDVVGEALSVLVITKLPFSVPSDPIFAARSEQFKDPFSEYSVPQSILRFKQGFGRLIRSKEDRGIVVVLDKRLLTRKYGEKFLHSLPATRVRTGPLKQLPPLAAQFLASCSTGTA